MPNKADDPRVERDYRTVEVSFGSTGMDPVTVKVWTVLLETEAEVRDTTVTGQISTTLPAMGARPAVPKRATTK
jgi:hypothetical protein